MKFTSLQQRMLVLLLLPVAVVITVLGSIAFLYARDRLLDQWQEAAVLRLERAAHFLDMRLAAPLELINLFGRTGQAEAAGQQAWLLEQIRNLRGVIRADMIWEDGRPQIRTDRRTAMGGRRPGMMMPFRRSAPVTLSKPELDVRTGVNAVLLTSRLADEQGRELGRLEVALDFDYLLSDVTELGWWQADRAALVDQAGNIVTGTRTMVERKRLSENGSPFEARTLTAMADSPSGTLRGEGHPAVEVSGWFRLTGTDWFVVMFAPGRTILAPILSFRNNFIVMLIGVVILVLILIRLTANRTVKSIERLSEAAAKVADGDLTRLLEVESGDEIGRLQQDFNRMTSELARRERINNTFGRYVDDELAREILERPEAARLGGDKRSVAILFSDIRGFTAISEELTPEQTLALVNGYLSTVIEVIREHRGIIVDFLGDGLLAFFDPLDGPLDEAVVRSVACALAMQRSMEDFNARSGGRGLPPVRLGIGLNCGPVVVGNIGSEIRTKYGIVGLEVNLTARVQSLARGGQVVATGQVARRAGNDFKVVRTFKAELKGVSGPREMAEIGPLV